MTLAMWENGSRSGFIGFAVAIGRVKRLLLDDTSTRMAMTLLPSPSPVFAGVTLPSSAFAVASSRSPPVPQAFCCSMQIARPTLLRSNEHVWDLLFTSLAHNCVTHSDRTVSERRADLCKE